MSTESIEKQEQFEGGANVKRDNHTDDKTNDHNLYSRSMMEMKVILLPMEIGENKTAKNIHYKIVSQIEGKCIREGYVKPKSTKIIRYSSGLVKNEFIEFSVVFECKTCSPVEGTLLYNCVCTSVTKGGIHGDIFDKDQNVPATVYIYRDQFAENRTFQNIKKGDTFHMKVIGIRYELNDPCVEIIGQLYNA